MSQVTRLIGWEAIRHVEAHGGTLAKFADPIERARPALTVEQAKAVAREDPGLIYCDPDYCAIHHVPLTCAACSGAKGGQATSPTKTRAAQANARQPRKTRTQKIAYCAFPSCRRLAGHLGAHWT